MKNINNMENSNLEEQKYIRAKKKVKAIKGFYVHLTVYILVNIFLIVTRSFSNDGFEDLWEWQTYNTAIFWGIGIVFHAFNVFGMNFLLGSKWEERKIKEMMDKDKKDMWE
tara:strand:+ start:9692 stop:10024 length:333 start_codon:yes stop_codon:yes gene_type:complete